MWRFVIFLAISLASSDKLNRKYLPPPGSKFAGGRPSDLGVPLEFPKESYITSETYPGSSQKPAFRQSTHIKNIPEERNDQLFNEAAHDQNNEKPGLVTSENKISTQESNRDVKLEETNSRPLNFLSTQPDLKKYLPDSIERVESTTIPVISTVTSSIERLPNNLNINSIAINPGSFYNDSALYNQNNNKNQAPFSLQQNTQSEPQLNKKKKKTNLLNTYLPVNQNQYLSTTTNLPSLMASVTIPPQSDTVNQRFDEYLGVQAPSLTVYKNNLELNKMENQDSSTKLNNLLQLSDSYFSFPLHTKFGDNFSSQGGVLPEKAVTENKNIFENLLKKNSAQNTFPQEELVSSTPYLQDVNENETGKNTNSNIKVKTFGANIPTILTSTQQYPKMSTSSMIQLEGNNIFRTAPRYERPKSKSDRVTETLHDEKIITPEGYYYGYDTSNGIHADESASTLNGNKATGSYSYIGDNGKLYKIVYTADENGYVPHGDHLPTPPPVPEAIQRVIEQAERDRDARIIHDGFYDEGKYGYNNYEHPSYTKQPKINYDNIHENFKNIDQELEIGEPGYIKSNYHISQRLPSGILGDKDDQVQFNENNKEENSYYTHSPNVNSTNKNFNHYKTHNGPVEYPAKELKVNELNGAARPFNSYSEIKPLDVADIYNSDKNTNPEGKFGIPKVSLKQNEYNNIFEPHTQRDKLTVHKLQNNDDEDIQIKGFVEEPTSFDNFKNTYKLASNTIVYGNENNEDTDGYHYAAPQTRFNYNNQVPKRYEEFVENGSSQHKIGYSGYVTKKPVLTKDEYDYYTGTDNPEILRGKISKPNFRETTSTIRYETVKPNSRYPFKTYNLELSSTTPKLDIENETPSYEVVKSTPPKQVNIGIHTIRPDQKHQSNILINQTEPQTNLNQFDLNKNYAPKIPYNGYRASDGENTSLVKPQITQSKEPFSSNIKEIHNEDFTGPTQPQKFDSESGYYY